MKKITTKADFNLAHERVRQMNDKMNYSDPIEVPDYINEIINVDRGVQPKHLDFHLIKELLLFELLKLRPNYTQDNFSSQIIDQLCLYACEDEKFLTNKSFSINKGILIMGKVGCGKTLIMSAFANLMSWFKYPFHISRYKFDVAYLPVYLITDNFIKIGFTLFDDFHNINNSAHKIAQDICREKLFIDDIGSENIVSSFGNTTNVIGELILRRYDFKGKLFASTNIDPKSLKSFYGERVFSRMTEMLNFIVMDGEDRRR